MNRILWCMLLSAAHSLSVGAADFEAWTSQQSLEVARPGLAKILLSPETIHTARADLGDLRLVDPDGNEVPYQVVRPRTPMKSVRRLEKHTVALEARTTRIELPVPQPTRVRGVRLETPAADFMKPATVEAVLPNGSVQPLIRRQAWFRQRGAERLGQSLPPLPSNLQTLRVILDDTRSAPIPITAVLLEEEETEGVTPLRSAATVVDRQEGVGETRLLVDVGAARLPMTGLRLQTSDPMFMRTLRVITREWGSGGIEERVLARGRIHRLPVEESGSSEELEVEMRFSSESAEWVVAIDNGDSPPLSVTGIEFLHEPLHLLFHARGAGAYTLRSGNPGVRTPRYDVAGFGDQTRESLAATLTLGPMAANPGYRPPGTLAEVPLLGAAADASEWLFHEPLDLGVGGVHRLKLPLHALAHARRDLGDIRLLSGGRQVLYLMDQSRLFTPVEVKARVVPVDGRPNLTRWELTLPLAGLPVMRIRCEAISTLFERIVHVWEEGRDRGLQQRERALGSATWVRTPGGPRVQFDVELGSSPTGNTVWLETDNGDNAALELGRIQGFVRGAQVLFQTEGTNRVDLCYGNPKATKPDYDLNLIAPRVLAAAKHEVILADHRLGTSQGGGRVIVPTSMLLYAGLAAVVAGLVFVIAKLIPRPQP